MINIKVNNKKYDLPKEITVSELLEFLNIENKNIAIAVDKKVCGKSKWEDYKVTDGNEIDILVAVQGG